MITAQEKAWKIWLSAYKKQYQDTGLMSPEIISYQAWQAALNYVEQTSRELKQTLNEHYKKTL